MFSYKPHVSRRFDVLDEMVSELKQKLEEQEMKVRAEEKEPLVNQIQELQIEFSGILYAK